MIATVDKFANVPWEGRAGAFFGHVERDDQTGFYGAAEPGGGTRLTGELRPIDLIIQDELHLISGPLGTIAGLYETAFDLLASRMINGERRGPKIVASTATVRRAETQIRNLFGRAQTAIFPPPGVDRNNSFFAEVDRRRHRGSMSASPRRGAGRSSSSCAPCRPCCSGAAALSSGGTNDPADPYLTALCYFNALRELGGARRIVDDEVRAHLTNYGTQPRPPRANGRAVRRSTAARDPGADLALHAPIRCRRRARVSAIRRARRTRSTSRWPPT